MEEQSIESHDEKASKDGYEKVFPLNVFGVVDQVAKSIDVLDH